jgi:hypothetical protein
VTRDELDLAVIEWSRLIGDEKVVPSARKVICRKPPEVWAFRPDDLVYSVSLADELGRRERTQGVVFAVVTEVVQVLWPDGSFGTYWPYELNPHQPQDHNYVGLDTVPGLVEKARNFRILSYRTTHPAPRPYLWRTPFGMGDALHNRLAVGQDGLIQRPERELDAAEDRPEAEGDTRTGNGRDGLEGG